MEGGETDESRQGQVVCVDGGRLSGCWRRESVSVLWSWNDDVE